MPVKVCYKIYKPGDIVMGEIFTDEEDKRAFVISNDIICEIANIDDIQTKNVNVMLTKIKSTSGCAFFSRRTNIIFLIKSSLRNNYLFFIFNYISKSIIINDIILFNSLRITFCIKLLYPIFDRKSYGKLIYLSNIIFTLLNIFESFLIAFIKASIYYIHILKYKYSYLI